MRFYFQWNKIASRSSITYLTKLVISVQGCAVYDEEAFDLKSFLSKLPSTT